MSLAGYERRWRALIPIWNVFVLGDLCSVGRLWLVGPWASIGMVILYEQLVRRSIRLQWLGAILYAVVSVLILGGDISSSVFLAAAAFYLLSFPVVALLAKGGGRFEPESSALPGHQTSRFAEPAGGVAEQKLREIETMRGQGLITRDEANRQRQAVLDEAVGRLRPGE